MSTLYIMCGAVLGAAATKNYADGDLGWLAADMTILVALCISNALDPSDEG